jgi:hypothetical protein
MDACTAFADAANVQDAMSKFVQFIYSNASDPYAEELQQDFFEHVQALQMSGVSEELLLALRDFMYQCAQAKDDISLCICLAHIMTQKSDELHALEYVRSASKNLGIARPGILEVALNMMVDAHKTTLDFFIEICRAYGFFPKLLRTIEVLGSFGSTRKGSRLDGEFEKMSAYFPERPPNVDWENVVAHLSQFFAAEEGLLPGSNLAEFIKQCLVDSILKEELSSIVGQERVDFLLSVDELYFSFLDFVDIDLIDIAIDWTNVVSSWRKAIEPRLAVTPHSDEALPEDYYRHIATLPLEVQQGINRMPYLLVMKTSQESQYDPAYCFWPLLREFRVSWCKSFRVKIVTDSDLALAFKFAQHPRFLEFIEDSIAKVVSDDVRAIPCELSKSQKERLAEDSAELARFRQERRYLKGLIKEKQRDGQCHEDEAMSARLDFLDDMIDDLKKLVVLPAQVIDLRTLTAGDKYVVADSLKGYSVFFKLVHWVQQCCGGAGSDPASVETITQLSDMWRTLHVHLLPVKVLLRSPFGNFDNILAMISDVSNASLYVQAQLHVTAECPGLWCKLISHHDWSGRTFFEYILDNSIYEKNPLFSNIINSITTEIMVADAKRWAFYGRLNREAKQCRHIGNQFISIPVKTVKKRDEVVFTIGGALDLSSPHASKLSSVLVKPRHIMESVAQFLPELFFPLLNVVYDGIFPDVIGSFSENTRLDKQLVSALVRALGILKDAPAVTSFIWERDKEILLTFIRERGKISLNDVARTECVHRLFLRLIADPILQNYEKYRMDVQMSDIMGDALMPSYISFWKRLFCITMHESSLVLSGDIMGEIFSSCLDCIYKSEDPVYLARNIISNAFILFAPRTLSRCGCHLPEPFSRMFASKFNDLFIKGLDPKLLYKVLAMDGTLFYNIFRSFVLATTPSARMMIIPCEWPKDTNLQVLTNPGHGIPRLFFDGFFEDLDSVEFRYQVICAAKLDIVDEEYDFERTPAYNARKETFLAERQKMRKGNVFQQSPKDHWPILHSVVQVEQG